MTDQTQYAFFAAGCFWGVEETFRQLHAINKTRVGYMGGTLSNPSYEQVCSGKTNHAETVRVNFDPDKISYQQLLQLFWKCHDPTQLNRQGWDIGTQYRSAIFSATQQQYELAQTSKQKLLQQGLNIKTEILPPPPPPFFSAEDYHQQYLQKRKIGA